MLQMAVTHRAMSMLLPALLCLGASAGMPGFAPTRVDLSPDFRRNDTGAPHWREWQVPNGPEATHQIAGISVTLRQARASGSPLEGQWFKPALAAGAGMACDGVFVSDGSLEIVLQGLPPGPHTLVTYHNSLWKEPMAQRIWMATDIRIWNGISTRWRWEGKRGAKNMESLPKRWP